MKNSIFTGLCAVLLLVGCATKNAVKQTENQVRGNWVIDSVTYNGTGEFESTLLQDVSAECFEGSQWYFVANNNRGNYSIETLGCRNGVRNFIWTVPGSDQIIEGDLLIKPTGDNYKSDTDAGFRVNVRNLTENTMTWNQSVLVDGRTVVVSMNFRKLAE
jgi:hypothetical protein